MKGIYCNCIEKTMPRQKTRTVGALPKADIDRFSVDRPGILDFRKIVSEFKRCGLDQLERKLVWLKVVVGLQFKEVVEEQGWLCRNSASYYLKKALKKLRVGKASFK